MKLKNFDIEHPHHSNYTITDGTPLYNYQYEACKIVLKDFTSKTKNDNYGKTNILKIPTGDGKTFISEFLVSNIIDSNKKKKTIFLCSPLTEVLEDLKEKIKELVNSRDDIEAFFDKDYPGVDNIKSYDKNHSMDIHEIFVFSDKWAEFSKNYNCLPKECDFLIRDESKGVNSSNPDDAREYLGEYNYQGEWYKRLISFGGYTLVLNATPTNAQIMGNDFNILNIEVEDNYWKKPFLNEVCALYAETPQYKKQELKRFLYDFLVKNITFRYRVNRIQFVPLTKKKKKSAIIKCSTSAALLGLTTSEVESIIIEYNQELTGQEFDIIDPKTNQIVKYKYEGDLLNPMIKDINNPNSLFRINKDVYKENILIVCELGTYGVNVKNCSHLFLIRDSMSQHIGKTYTAEQLFGRLKRNLWNDWIFMLDDMLSTTIDIKDYEWIRDTFMDVASKNLWYLKTNVNENAFHRFDQEMPNRQQISDTIDDLVLNLFKYLPSDKDVMVSTGDSEDRNYSNQRNDKCDSCNNLIFDIHYEKLIQKGHGKVTARGYAIKDIMDNGHRHTKDDDTQRSICKSCHAIETRENKHYLASDNPERKEVA